MCLRSADTLRVGGKDWWEDRLSEMFKCYYTRETGGNCKMILKSGN